MVRVLSHLKVMHVRSYVWLTSSDDFLIHLKDPRSFSALYVNRLHHGLHPSHGPWLLRFRNIYSELLELIFHWNRSGRLTRHSPFNIYRILIDVIECFPSRKRLNPTVKSFFNNQISNYNSFFRLYIKLKIVKD